MSVTESRWPPAMAPAFAASLVIHGALALALIGLVSAGLPATRADETPLSIHLVDAPQSAPVVASPVPAPAPKAPEPARRAPQAEPRPLAAAAIALAAPPAERAAAPPAVGSPSLALGSVEVDASYGALPSLSQPLVLRTQGTYMPEVEKTVEVARKPTVAYPPDALAAGRDGTVLAWLAISREGEVEEVVIDSGEPEFVEAATAAIPTAKFLPAEERGERIPFWIVMTFEFRSGASASPAVTAGDSPR